MRNCIATRMQVKLARSICAVLAAFAVIIIAGCSAQQQTANIFVSPAAAAPELKAEQSEKATESPAPKELLPAQNEPGGIAGAPENVLAVSTGDNVYYIEGHELNGSDSGVDDGLYYRNSEQKIEYITSPIKAVPYNDDFELYLNGKRIDAENNSCCYLYMIGQSGKPEFPLRRPLTHTCNSESFFRLYSVTGSLLTWGIPVMSRQYPSLRALPEDTEESVIAEALIPVGDGKHGFQYVFGVTGIPQYVPDKLDKYKPLVFGRLDAAEEGHDIGKSSQFGDVRLFFDCEGCEIEMTVTAGEIVTWSGSETMRYGKECRFSCPEHDVYLQLGFIKKPAEITYTVYEDGKAVAKANIEIIFVSDEDGVIRYSMQHTWLDTQEN